ncbi:WXG100 family type VII secretion target [Glycomyces buryatensis]|uniref:WXG100 family type VII secretion target n=1 Tax=Glycomyces buryatensis TaxID=2570927 RepID=A0A4S8QEB3_9ACTN|nr:type VII secretion target [Glycomyces buryatensis]THV41432.1 hypothetical protein FAB82_11580 [Glycomyces buryatensis]
MARIIVESDRLRSAAERIRQFAAETKDLPHQLDGSAERATKANSGLMCAGAAQELAEDFRRDMEQLSEHLDDTQEVIDDAALHWGYADQDAANDFWPMQLALRTFKVPTIDFGPPVTK